MVGPSHTMTDAEPALTSAGEPDGRDGLRKGKRSDRIALTLSAAQVGQVMRAVTGHSGGTALVGGENAIGIDEPRYRELVSDRRLSRSLLSGLMILRCFQEDDELGIAELSRRLDMRTSTTHRYVSTLRAAGLLERDPVSRQYRLAQP